MLTTSQFKYQIKLTYFYIILYLGKSSDYPNPVLSGAIEIIDVTPVEG